MKPKATVVTALLLFLFSASISLAQFAEFTGEGDGFSWGDPNNWEPAGVPFGGIVQISSYVEVNVGILTMNVIQLNEGAFMHFTLPMNVGDLAIEGDVTLSFASRGNEAGGPLMLPDTQYLEVLGEIFQSGNIDIRMTYGYGYAPAPNAEFKVIQGDNVQIDCSRVSVLGSASSSFATYDLQTTCSSVPVDVQTSITSTNYNQDVNLWVGGNGNFSDASNWSTGTPNLNSPSVILDPVACPRVVLDSPIVTNIIAVGECATLIASADFSATRVQINREAGLEWNSGKITTSSSSSILGGIVFDSPEDKTLTGGNFWILGPANANQGNLFLNDVDLSIFASGGGVLNINGDDIRIGQSSGEGTLRNFQSVIRKTRGTGDSYIETTNFTDSRGTIDVQEGRLIFGSPNFNAPDATFSGEGGFGFPSGFIFDGVLSPGGVDQNLTETPFVQSVSSDDGIASIGSLEIVGDLTASSSAQIVIEINESFGSGEFDQIVVSGDADISAELVVIVSDEAILDYEILTANSVDCNNIPRRITSSDGNWPFVVACSQNSIILFSDALPVELSDFGHTLNGQEVELFWTTETETNNQGFEIQSRTAQDNWRQRALVDGAGTSLSQNQYSVLIPEIESGVVEYRLKQIDFDGTSSYSKVIEVYIPTSLAVDFSIYPNPAVSSAELSIYLQETTLVEISVFDALGRFVHDLGEKRILGQERAKISVDMTGMAHGNYFIQVKGEDFSKIEKLVLTQQ